MFGKGVIFVPKSATGGKWSKERWWLTMKTGKEQDKKKRRAEAERLCLKGEKASRMSRDRTWEERQAESAKWYRKAAILGLAEAEYQLGMYYEFRREPDAREKAEKWFRKAAEQGHRDAQYRLGWMLEMRRGTLENAEAAVWYRKAAKKGHLKSMCALAGLYEVGHGVRKSYKIALKWYLKAAMDYDYCDAQYHLGLMCQFGDGVKQSDVEAVKWFRAAAESGHEPAMKELELMGEEVPD